MNSSPRAHAAARISLRGTLPRFPGKDPEAGTLLSVDDEYRRCAARGELDLIEPGRGDPDLPRWVPVLLARRGPWEFKAMYCTSPLARRLGCTHDWVTIEYRVTGGVRRSAMVVTEHLGPRAGERVVRRPDA